MLALVLALSLSSSEPSINLHQLAPPEQSVDAVADIDVSGSERQVFCVRSEQTHQTRIRRPTPCRTQAEWRQLAAARMDEQIILMKYLGRLSMDSFLTEQAVTGAEANRLRAEDRRLAAVAGR